MSLKWFLVVLLALVVLEERVNADSACGQHLTDRQCLSVLVRSKKDSPHNAESTNPLSDPAWFERLLKPAVEPTCKLRDIFNLLSNDCQSELLQILNLLLTNPDY